MKKSKPLVTIPQNTVCISLSDVLFSHAQIRQKDYRIAELETQVSELTKKLSDTEAELAQVGDRKMYWYDRYMKLTEGSEKGDPNAQAKTT